MIFISSSFVSICAPRGCDGPLKRIVLLPAFGRCAKQIFNQWAEKPVQMSLTSGERPDKSAAGAAKTQ